MLWVQLFDSSTDSVLAPIATSDAFRSRHPTLTQDSDAEATSESANGVPTSASCKTHGATSIRRLEELEKRLLDAAHENKGVIPPQFSRRVGNVFSTVVEEAMREGKRIEESHGRFGAASGPFLVYIGKTALKVRQDLSDLGRKCLTPDIVNECRRRWLSLRPEEQEVSVTCLSSSLMLTVLVADLG